MTILEEINSLYDKCFSESNAARRRETKPKKEDYIKDKYFSAANYEIYPHTRGRFGRINFSPDSAKSGPGFTYVSHDTERLDGPGDYFIYNKASEQLVKKLDSNLKGNLVFITGNTDYNAIEGVKDLYYAVWLPLPETVLPYNYAPKIKKNGKWFFFSDQLLEPKSVVKLKNNIPLTSSDLSNGNMGKTDKKLEKKVERLENREEIKKREIKKREMGFANSHSVRNYTNTKKELRLQEVYKNFINIIEKYEPYINVNNSKLNEYSERIRKSSTPQERLKIFSGFESYCLDKKLDELKERIIYYFKFKYPEITDNIMSIQNIGYYFNNSEQKFSYIKKINLLIEKLKKASTEEEKKKIVNTIDNFLKNTNKEIRQLIKNKNKYTSKPFEEEILETYNKIFNY